MASDKNKGKLLETLVRGTVDLIPPEFRARIGLRITTQKVPNDVLPDAISETLIESKVEQSPENTNERRKVNTELEGDVDEQLEFEVKLPDGQTGTGVRSLVDEGTGLTVTALTEEATQRNLGNGKLDQTVITKPSTLPLPEYTEEIPDSVPEEFRALVPITSSEVTSAGTAAAPTLTTGQLLKRETQLNKWLKRVLVRARSLGSLPATLAGRRMYQGLEATVERKLATGDQTMSSPDFLTVDGEVRATGAGTSVREKVVVTEFPDQPGQDLDEETGAVLPFIQKTVELGDSIGDADTDIQPMDYVRARKKVYDTEAIDEVLDAYMVSYPGPKIDVNWPSVLRGVDIIWELGGGEGTADENGSVAAATEGTSVNVNSSTEAHSSKHAVPQILADIDHPYGAKKNTTEYFFYLKGPTFDTADVIAKLPGSVVDWPNFNPKMHYVLLVGIKVQVAAHAGARYSSSTSDSGTSTGYSTGGGQSYDGGPQLVLKEIGPVINDAISFTGLYGASVHSTITAHAAIDLGAITAGPFDPEFDVDARVVPSSLSATAGDTDIPSGIDVIDDVRVRPYKHKWFAVYVRVLNL